MVKKTTTQTTHGPRMLGMYQLDRSGSFMWFHALVWVEQSLKGEPVAAHIIRNDNGRVVHERKRPEELQFVEGTSVRTTAARYEQYLRDKLLANGGNPGAYEYLGVARPSVETVVSTEKKADHDELYARASRVLKVPEAELREKYGRLNPGLQAMNLRNRLRKAGRAV